MGNTDLYRLLVALSVAVIKKKSFEERKGLRFERLALRSLQTAALHIIGHSHRCLLSIIRHTHAPPPPHPPTSMENSSTLLLQYCSMSFPGPWRTLGEPAVLRSVTEQYRGTNNSQTDSGTAENLFTHQNLEMKVQSETDVGSQTDRTVSTDCQSVFELQKKKKE